jgi:hypothetical protein
MLNAFIGEQLHTDANAEKRRSFQPNALLHRGGHAINGAQSLHTMRKGAYAGQNNTVRRGNDSGISGHANVGRARRLQGIMHRMQIARAIINQRK